ncbi:G-type lectin S-receptor-like serine/threonine-protein kinase LECRK1 [Frankliniella fusca]|uniref:G-type lectin S-receptor-like serine/threonine-protein kinase LECRK1 n=1 Tax=Frankliniella fusca TaxID=407009 RepID=A0AAE1LPD3_9NEOP|nr:G-type lectin S-receptor-like serine/threonine-protein kinase LECRK1 [Frankliniella fusca]
MTPVAMWCEFMKMFYRLLSSCHILVQEFPADMSGYQGGALSKLLVQSLRPEWNKQEIASVGVDLVELHECIVATGVVTPDEELQNESSTALQKPTLQRRRSAFSFMLCCARERSPPLAVEEVAEAVTANGPDSSCAGRAGDVDINDSSANHPDKQDQDEDQDQDQDQSQPAGDSKAYDPCTPWDSM